MLILLMKMTLSFALKRRQCNSFFKLKPLYKSFWAQQNWILVFFWEQIWYASILTFSLKIVCFLLFDWRSISNFAQNNQLLCRIKPLVKQNAPLSVFVLFTLNNSRKQKANVVLFLESCYSLCSWCSWLLLKRLFFLKTNLPCIDGFPLFCNWSFASVNVALYTAATSEICSRMTKNGPLLQLFQYLTISYCSIPK